MINLSDNDYRWKRIEEYLISEGYVLQDSSTDLNIWVDCTSNGKNIHHWRSPTSFIDPSTEGTFNIMCTHSLDPWMVYSRAETVDQAVRQSRDIARW
jgi:hypothetical protein